MRKTLIRLIALLLCLPMMASCAAIAESPALLSEPDLPDMAPYPGSTDGMRFNQDEQEAWYASLSAQHRDPSYMAGLVPFLTSSAKQILSGARTMRFRQAKGSALCCFQRKGMTIWAILRISPQHVPNASIRV